MQFLSLPATVVNLLQPLLTLDKLSYSIQLSQFGLTAVGGIVVVHGGVDCFDTSACVDIRFRMRHCSFDLRNVCDRWPRLRRSQRQVRQQEFFFISIGIKFTNKVVEGRHLRRATGKFWILQFVWRLGPPPPPRPRLAGSPRQIFPG